MIPEGEVATEENTPMEGERACFSRAKKADFPRGASIPSSCGIPF